MKSILLQQLRIAATTISMMLTMKVSASLPNENGFANPMSDEMIACPWTILQNNAKLISEKKKEFFNLQNKIEELRATIDLEFRTFPPRFDRIQNLFIEIAALNFSVAKLADEIAKLQKNGAPAEKDQVPPFDCPIMY